MTEFTNEDITYLKEKNINILIKKYMPLIIKTITSLTGKYVSVENDDEFSIALMAFKESIDKYNSEKGSFPSFAKLVIESRVKNYILNESKHQNTDSIDRLKENGIDISEIYHTPLESSDVLAVEISTLKSEINKFGFTFEDLVNESPKHEDTRKRAIGISSKINEDLPIKTLMYEKKRLPVKQISLKFSITEKIIKRSKRFIISVVIILDKNFRNLKLWIRG